MSRIFFWGGYLAMWVILGLFAYVLLSTFLRFFLIVLAHSGII
jgi:hypothetical protein